MTKRAIWFAITLLAFGPAAFGGAVSGVSNTFAIDNTKVPPPLVTSTGQSPYGDGIVLLKGQLHSHSYPDKWYLWDGTDMGPLSTMNKYYSLGYDFVAVTDHNIVSPDSLGWQGWAPNSVEITHGINDTHVIAVGNDQGSTMDMLDYPTTGHIASDTVQRVTRVHDRGGLAYVAHPDSWPYNIGVYDLLTVVNGSGPNGIGIWTPAMGEVAGAQVGAHDSQNMWDKLVYALGRPVWGYVEDDYHPDTLSNWKKGRTWVAVPGSPGEWWGDIKEDLRSGNYYCYFTTWGKWPGGNTPPQMRVTVSNSGPQPVISVYFDRSVNYVEFRGWDGGSSKVLAWAGSVSSAQYQATGREKFVRVKARYEFSGGTLWMTSQPIVINKNGSFSPYYAPMLSGDGRLMSTSPELQLVYVDSDSKPLAPPAGYVGDVFDVTTADSQVPPGATLQLTYAEEDTAPLGGTQYLAIYRYDDASSAWVKVGGTVDPGTQTIESPITALGKYCISADLPADTTAPEVLIDNPPYGGVVSTDTTLKATVNDDLGAWRVRFYLNDHLVSEDTSGLDGWSADIKIADYCAGNWTLKALAEDLAGNEGSVEVPIYIASLTPLPTVTIASPAPDSTLSGTVTASGTCGDDVAVAMVALKMDDTVVGYADIDGANWTCQVDTSYLADGSRALTATVEDYPGNSASASVPVTIDSGIPSVPLGAAKGLGDGAPVRFGAAIVVADPALTGDGYYVESTNRASGIMVRTTKALNVGDAVSLVGTAAASPTGNSVNAYDVAVLSSGNTLPKPLGMSAKLLLRSPDSIGKIVKIWGDVEAIDTANPAKWFTLKDPSGIVTTCALGSGVTIGSDWTMVAVTGVASCELVGGQLKPVVLIGSSSDIRNLLGP